MNKKIKVIELFELIFNNKQIPQKILYDNEEYVFNGESFVCCDHDTTSLLSEYNKSRLIEFLNDEVEILEDNTEEIILTEKIFVPMELNLIDYDKNLINNCFESQNALINQLVRAVNKLRKEKE